MNSIIFQKLVNKEEEVLSAPIMVFANKQDLEDSMTPDEISEILKLSDIKNRSWSIYKTSAVTGEGLKEGMEWMAKEVTKLK